MSKTLPITKYRKYDTYQALYEVHPGNEDAVLRYKRTVLQIVKWLRSRYSPEESQDIPGNDKNDDKGTRTEDAGIARIREYLADYPEPEEYASFDMGGIGDLETPEVDDIHICSYDHTDGTSEWAVQVTEPGRDINVTICTNIGVRLEGNTVSLAVNGSKKLPVGAEDIGVYYRPKFLREICLKDPVISLSEAGIQEKYKYGREAVHVNGKSDPDLSAMISDLLDTPARQLPVYIMSEVTAEKLGMTEGYDKERAVVDAAAQAVIGYASVIVIDKSVRKLFVHKGYEKYAESLDEGCILRRDSASDPGDVHAISEDRFDEYFRIDDKNRMVGIIVDESRSLMEHRRCDYGNVRFWREVHSSKREEALRTIFGGADYDPEKLKTIMEDLQAQNNELQSELAQEKEERLSERESLIEENRKIAREADKYRNRSLLLEESKDELKGQNQSLSGQMEMLKKETEGSSDNEAGISEYEIFCMHDPMFNLPVRKEGICEWIRNNYPETIIINDRAEAALSKDDRNLDLNMLVEMIHCLHGYTLARNEGMSSKDIKNMIKRYDVGRKNFEICSVGDPASAGSTTSKEDQKKYDIDIIEADGRRKTVRMNLHMKKGNSPETLIRIYFYYDPDLKKSIIGYMPDHLPLRKSGHT